MTVGEKIEAWTLIGRAGSGHYSDNSICGRVSIADISRMSIFEDMIERALTNVEFLPEDHDLPEDNYLPSEIRKMRRSGNMPPTVH
jgi:hypothetical protein